MKMCFEADLLKAKMHLVCLKFVWIASRALWENCEPHDFSLLLKDNSTFNMSKMTIFILRLYKIHDFRFDLESNWCGTQKQQRICQLIKHWKLTLAQQLFAGITESWTS